MTNAQYLFEIARGERVQLFISATEDRIEVTLQYGGSYSDDHIRVTSKGEVFDEVAGLVVAKWNKAMGKGFEQLLPRLGVIEGEWK